ncbi:Zn-ribbon domain-containing OB-fold protein [Streptomyces sp. NPDC096311]|uniref:Zn-ribbon domain-containing OB-fold protein n=1 Tax=Streptomyces sp. NPDC096311 TaxID=3366083 RepID=UPI0038030FE1
MTVTNAGRTDLPTVDDDSRVYWDAYRDREFLIARCGACERVHHYPRPQCPFCWSEDVSPTRASGDATLYTYSIVHMNDLAPFRDQLPYVAAVVELAEGPRVMTQVVGCSPEQLRIGMALTVDFEVRTEDITAPVFRPAG